MLGRTGYATCSSKEHSCIHLDRHIRLSDGCTHQGERVNLDKKVV